MRLGRMWIGSLILFLGLSLLLEEDLERPFLRPLLPVAFSLVITLGSAEEEAKLSSPTVIASRSRIITCLSFGYISLGFGYVSYVGYATPLQCKEGLKKSFVSS
ncbi:hypothetical protein SK128_026929 [Halocaridina rubra]|uniref:Uncharacterized protein n=1 Tax=Halocaridina rubra TaxID=373956 RepID=A0AAN8XJM6_HALRR